MSITKEEIVWLLEQCGAEMPEPSPCEPPEDSSEDTLTGKPDHEIEMAHKQLRNAASQAQSLADRLENMQETNLPAWVQSKITKVNDYMSTIFDYLDDYVPGQAAAELTLDLDNLEALANDQNIAKTSGPINEDEE